MRWWGTREREGNKRWIASVTTRAPGLHGPNPNTASFSLSPSLLDYLRDVLCSWFVQSSCVDRNIMLPNSPTHLNRASFDTLHINFHPEDKIHHRFFLFLWLSNRFLLLLVGGDGRAQLEIDEADEIAVLYSLKLRSGGDKKSHRARWRPLRVGRLWTPPMRTANSSARRSSNG